MNRKGRMALAAALVLGLAGAAAALPAAYAESHGGHGRAMGAGHIDGRIAYLKAELKITPGQEAAWSGVAQAMRDNAGQLGKLRDAMQADRGKPQNAVDRLDRRARLSQIRTQTLVAFASAFKPLYDQLSDDQRKAADALFQPRFRHG